MGENAAPGRDLPAGSWTLCGTAGVALVLIVVVDAVWGLVAGSAPGGEARWEMLRKQAWVMADPAGRNPYALAPGWTVWNLPEAPSLPRRPSRLLARAEHGFRLWRFNQRYRQALPGPGLPDHLDPLKTRNAEIYRQLADVAASYEIPLAPCTFNMAVTEQSPPDLIYFDLVHFEQPGREGLAANVLNGVRGVLESEPRLRCRLRQRRAIR